MKVRRALLSELSDAAYDTVQSFHSDSAVCFSIFLHHLPDLTSQHPPSVLLHAMEVIPGAFPKYDAIPAQCLGRRFSCCMPWQRATKLCCEQPRFSLLCLGNRKAWDEYLDFTCHLQATLASIRTAQEGAAIAEVSLLNFVVSDGSTLVATRYVSHEGEEAASLYYAEGSAFQVHEQFLDPPLSPYTSPSMAVSACHRFRRS